MAPPSESINTANETGGRADVTRNTEEGQTPNVFAETDKVWLIGNGERDNLAARVVEFKKDASGNWVYKLCEENGSSLADGRFFGQEELRYR